MGKGSKKKLPPLAVQGRSIFSLPRGGERVPETALGVIDQDEQHPTWRLSPLQMEHSEGWSWEITPPVLQKIVAQLIEMERFTT